MLLPLLLVLSVQAPAAEKCALNDDARNGILDPALVGGYEGKKGDDGLVFGEHGIVDGRAVGWSVGGEEPLFQASRRV